MFHQVRLGGDSQQTFGHCSLCIHPAVEPMATPSGHIYCKECIVEFLLAKTQELRRQREAFEAQEKSQGVLCPGRVVERREEKLARLGRAWDDPLISDLALVPDP